MKKIITLMLTLIMVLGTVSAVATGVSAAPKYSVGNYTINTSSGVNLRSGPSTAYRKLTAIPNKKEVVVTNVKGSWGYTEYNGKKGWLSLNYAKYIAPKINDSTNTNTNTNTNTSSATNWDSLVGKTVANIKKGSNYTAWYGSSKNISAKSGYTGECTWYALGRFGEVTGVKLTKAPHAKYWLSTNKNNQKVTVLYGADKIVSKSIAVDTSGKYGHVMFIEHVEYDAKGNPQTVYFTECNWDCNSKYNAGRDCVVKKLSYRKFLSQRSPDGYIVAK